MSGADVLLLVPSRGRPANALRLWGACAQLAVDLDLVLGLDDDDPELPHYPVGMAKAVGPRLGMCGTLNRLAALFAGRHKVIGFCGDDHLPGTPRFDRLIVDALTEMGTGIVYGNDLLQGPNLPTAVFMTSDIVRTLGYMAPPTLKHMFLDNAWKEWGEAAGCLRYLPDLIIEHVHPEAGKAEADAGYREVWPLMSEDSDRYAEYKASGQFAADVERIKGLASSSVR